MERLEQLVGVESSLESVSQALFHFASGVGAPSVGAMHVTCADESERECIDAFQRGFVQYLLPDLKYARKSAFQIANLGGRYEWGAIRIAVDHYAVAPSQLMVAKINAHVGLDLSGDRPVWGRLDRYGEPSICCGALHGLMSGSPLPAAGQLREAFHSEGKDRLASLLDPEKVDPAHRSVCAALASARLQARHAVLDIQDYAPPVPTLFLVAASVTVNRAERDTEILCGYYKADFRGEGREVEYSGLGDDPAAYQITPSHGRISVSDEHAGRRRLARNHRRLVLEEYQVRRPGPSSPLLDERMNRIRRDVEREHHRYHDHSRLILQALLTVLAEVAPVPAAILLFSHGAVDIHHAWRIHRMAREMEADEEARLLLREVHDRVDRLDHDRAEALVELLMEEYRG